jgi:NAD(P)-dependent dehydrogenase (short-subunit alcohol dehydrogenase family)
MIDAGRAAFGTIDVLVCNAASNPHYGPMATITDEQFRKTLDNNIVAQHWLIQMVAPDMIAAGGGSIMITSSVGAFGPSLTLGTYNISKLAVIGLVRNWAAELGPHQIRVNAICPGLVRTDFAKALWDNEAAKQRAENQIPLRRLGEAEDFAGVAVFLAAPASQYMTGQAVTVCGGSNMWA